MEKKYQLPKEFANKWISALRSGEYEQGRGQLFYDYKDGYCEYCCLGVAANICGINDAVLNNKGDLSDIDETTKPVMPIQFFDNGYWFQLAVMKMNDEDMFSFNDIADWIEANVQFI